MMRLARLMLTSVLVLSACGRVPDSANKNEQSEQAAKNVSSALRSLSPPAEQAADSAATGEQKAFYLDCTGSVHAAMEAEHKTIHYLIDEKNSDVQALYLTDGWRSVCADGCPEPTTFVGDLIRWRAGDQTNVINRATGKHTVRGINGFEYFADFVCTKLETAPPNETRRF